MSFDRVCDTRGTHRILLEPGIRKNAIEVDFHCVFVSLTPRLYQREAVTCRIQTQNTHRTCGM